MLHTPVGSDAASVIGHGSSDGFQIHSPGAFWSHKFSGPSGVRAGPEDSVAFSVMELSSTSAPPVQLAPSGQISSNPQ